MAAVIYVAIAALLAAFLLALSAGMSWRTLTFGRMDTAQIGIERRLLALWQVAAVLLWALIVTVRAGFALPQYLMYARDMIWIVAGYDAIAAVVYLFSKSPWARRVWFPVFLSLTICATLVLRFAP